MNGEWRVRRFDRAAAPPPPGQLRLRVVLDNIRSAFNVGSIFRTSEGAGVEHLHLCGISATPENPKVQKTALGAERMVPWSHDLSTREVLAALRADGWTRVAVELTNRSVPYTVYSYPPRCALVFGHEVAGVPLPVLAECDAVIEIPLAGRKNSLNVATSAGIVLFEALRQGWSVAHPPPDPGGPSANSRS